MLSRLIRREQLGIDPTLQETALDLPILSPFGQTGENSPSRDKLCLGGGPHADGACHCCSCVHRVRIDRGRTRLVRVPAADGQRTSSVTSGGQLAVYRQEVRPFTDKQVARLKNFSVLISWHTSENRWWKSASPLAPRDLPRSEGIFHQAMPQSGCSGRVLCHEYRRSKRRCATVREMKEGPSKSAIRC